jgi:hypothetical protein
MTGVYFDFYSFGFPDGFVPVQPPEPLLIDDFLTVSSLDAVCNAVQKVLLDSTSGSILLQPEMLGVNYKKVKCPDLPSWMAASDRIKCSLIQTGAIRGPDYDSYVRSCLQLLMDPKSGGNGWSLSIFLEFDNAHRID